MRKSRQRAVRARARTRVTQPRLTSPATTTAAERTSAANRTPTRQAVAPPLPHGFLAGATLAPSVQKLPFAALALVGLAIAGLATLAASIAAYLLV